MSLKMELRFNLKVSPAQAIEIHEPASEVRRLIDIIDIKDKIEEDFRRPNFITVDCMETNGMRTHIRITRVPETKPVAGS